MSFWDLGIFYHIVGPVYASQSRRHSFMHLHTAAYYVVEIMGYESQAPPRGSKTKVQLYTPISN